MLLVVCVLALVGACLADITGSNPANGACLCISGSGVNIRSSPCGTVIGSANTGNCFTYQNSKSTCSLSGVCYEWFRINYGGNTNAYTAGTYLNVGSASQCSGGGGGSGAFTDKCMKCICQIESNCNANIGCIMDVGSLSCGAYQIKEPYWIDCGRPGSGWQSCANTLSCAETCVKAYMTRYGTFCTGGRAPTCEDYSRIHNGGPRGCTNSATNGYWAKVSSCCGGQNGCN